MYVRESRHFDKVHHVAALAQAHQEVVRLDVPMDEVVTVHKRGKHGDLVSQTVFSMKRPPQKLKRSSRLGPKSRITMMLKSPSVEPLHRRDADEQIYSVDFGLDHQLGVLGVDAFQLNCRLVVVRDVLSKVNFIEGTTPDFPTESVAISDSQLHCSPRRRRFYCINSTKCEITAATNGDPGKI